MRAAARRSASSAPTAPPTKRTICCRSSRARFSRTNNIDHERTTDYAAFARALAGHPGKTASLRDIASACAILLVGGNPTDEHPLLAWLLRTNVRLNRARLYIANSRAHQARAPGQGHCRACRRMATKTSTTILDRGETDFAKAVTAEESLIVIFGQEIRGTAIENLVAWGLKRGQSDRPLRLPRRPLELARRSRHGPLP